MSTEHYLTGFTILHPEQRSASGQDTADQFGAYTTVAFQLHCTAGGNDAGDTLDVRVQATIDGTNWIDVVRFPALTGPALMVQKIVSSAEQHGTMNPAVELQAGRVRHLLGEQYRVTYTISGDAAFTFSVMASCQ
jgi:hypothetical protein